MSAQKVDVLKDLQVLANVGEYRELREAMQNCLRKHEREGFAGLLERMKANADAVAELIEAAKLIQRMNKEVLPKFNWGASSLDSNAIDLLNRAPSDLAKALARLGGDV